MAEALTIIQLEESLASPERVRQNPFSILKAISGLFGTGSSDDKGRDMVLRALEWRDSFGAAGEILDALARSAGLYPYINPDNLDLRDSIAYEFHRAPNMGAFVFHREQAEVYRRLEAGDNVILSAPTSFGKSRLIDAVLASNRFRNVAIIVPTIALIDETRRRLSAFSSQYKIVSHLSQKPSERNIFIFTAERAVAYKDLPTVEFFVIDEFYKIGDMKDEEDRTVALNQAFYRLLKGGGQFYLLGPNIEHVPEGLEEELRCYFHRTKFATVAVDTIYAPGQGDSMDRLVDFAKTLTEPTLIFCSSPPRVNRVARALVSAGISFPSTSLRQASQWVGKTYHPDWIFGTGLLHGIGIHHGKLPRSLAQFTVRAFNDDRLKFLICTSTLIEGVNTKAKNVLIWDSEINNTPISYFTFNNIRGRSGRMFQHFVGRVVLFGDPPKEQLSSVDFPTFTQPETTPTALLIQMDQEDLSDRSKDRVKEYTDNKVLPIEVLKENTSVDPEAQLELARYIEANAATMWPRLAWKGFPTYPERTFACELIWKFFAPRSKNGVFSAKQLSTKIWQLYKTPSVATRVLAEIGGPNDKYKTQDPDEAVERVLQFDRNWAGFEFPRLLMTLSRIQAAVLSRLQLDHGDYRAFAVQVESAFQSPVVAWLDEYGIPSSVGRVLEPFLRTKSDLDAAIANLKALDLSRVTQLRTFERELVRDTQANL